MKWTMRPAKFWNHFQQMIIPEGMTDPDEISDWMSDETGYCHDGFRLVDQNGNDADMA